MSSIAQANRLKELELQVEALRDILNERTAVFVDEVQKLQDRIKALENRPKPGRPPKNG